MRYHHRAFPFNLDGNALIDGNRLSFHFGFRDQPNAFDLFRASFGVILGNVEGLFPLLGTALTNLVNNLTSFGLPVANFSLTRPRLGLVGTNLSSPCLFSRYAFDDSLIDRLGFHFPVANIDHPRLGLLDHCLLEQDLRGQANFQPTLGQGLLDARFLPK